MASPGDLLARIGNDRVPALTNADADDSIELSPSDYFLLSRVDGRTPIKTLRQMAGMGADAFDETFVKIMASGLVRVPGVPRTDALDIALAKVTGAYDTVAIQESRAASGTTSGVVPATSPEGDDDPAAVSPAPDVPERQAEPARSLSYSAESAPTAARATEESAEIVRSGAQPGTESEPQGQPAAANPPPVAESLDSLEGYLRAASQPDSELPANEFTRQPSTVRKRQYEPVPNQTPRAKKKPTPKLTLDLLPSGWPVPIQQFTFDPITMSTGTALNDEHKQVVLYYHYHLRRVTYYDLLGIEPHSGRREVKLAYFRLSKAFHPDRWYRQDTGDFGEMIEDVFKWLNRAYGVLSSPRKRKGYDKLVGRGYIGEWQLEKAPAPRPRREQVKSSESPAHSGNSKRTVDVLSARALRAANDGEWEQACDLYLRLVEVQDTPDLRIRLVECMLKANMDPHEIDRQLALMSSEEPRSVSLILLEAEVARRLDDLTRAEACFKQVIDLEPANPVARLGLERLGADESTA